MMEFSANLSITLWDIKFWKRHVFEFSIKKVVATSIVLIYYITKENLERKISPVIKTKKNLEQSVMKQNEENDETIREKIHKWV